MRLLLLLLITLPALANDAAKLKKGDVLVTTKKLDDGSILAIVHAIIKSPPAKVWQLIEDCSKYDTTMSNTKNAKELSRKGGDIVCQVEIVTPFPLANLHATTAVRHSIKEGVYRRSWRLLKGDFIKNEGAWILSPVADGKETHVEYRVNARTKIPLPGFIQESAQKRTLPELIGHLRKQLAK